MGEPAKEGRVMGDKTDSREKGESKWLQLLIGCASVLCYPQSQVDVPLKYAFQEVITSVFLFIKSNSLC